MGIIPLFKSSDSDRTSSEAEKGEESIAVNKLRSNEKFLSSSPSEVSLYLLEESLILYRFAMDRGQSLNPELTEQLFTIAQDIDLDPNNVPAGVMSNLSTIHQTLCTTITPATPKSARYLFEQKCMHARFKTLGDIPLVRQFSALTIMLLSGLFIVGSQPEVNADSIELGILHSQGMGLLLNLTFILICAGLGSCFSTLFKVNGFIAKGSFDPSYSTTYWSRLVLGMMSGIIIVELLPATLFSDDSLGSFGKPTMAMLAGFSADLVYRILEKLVNAVKSVLQGDEQSRLDMLEAKKQAEISQYSQSSRMEAAEKMMQVSKYMSNGDLDAAENAIKDYVSRLRSVR